MSLPRKKHSSNFQQLHLLWIRQQEAQCGFKILWNIYKAVTDTGTSPTGHKPGHCLRDQLTNFSFFLNAGIYLASKLGCWGRKAHSCGGNSLGTARRSAVADGSTIRDLNPTFSRTLSYGNTNSDGHKYQAQSDMQHLHAHFLPERKCSREQQPPDSEWLCKSGALLPSTFVPNALGEWNVALYSQTQFTAVYSTANPWREGTVLLWYSLIFSTGSSFRQHTLRT